MHFKLHPDKKRNIVILGAGYCGVQTAKVLASKLKNFRDYEVILVDRKSMHIYTSDLYEIGTAYYPRMTNACLVDLSEAVSIPLKITFRGEELTFLQDSVTTIDYEKRTVNLKKYGDISFEYLVLGLGSVTNFYKLPGVQENALPLKTVEDALALDCHFDQFFKLRWEANELASLAAEVGTSRVKNTNPVHIVVGGGGFTGVEYAAQLVGFINKLQGKYHFKKSEVKIMIVQGGPEIVGLGPKVAKIADQHLKKLGIKIICNSRICSYVDKKLEIISNDDQKPTFLPADVLVWTAGVKPNPILKSFPILTKTGAIETLPTLESAHYPKVYAGGDNAAIVNPKNGEFLPMLGQLAVQEGKSIGNNISAEITGRQKKVYKPFFKGFIVPLGGKYAIYKGFITFGGIIPWLMRKFVDLMYFASLMPLRKAIKKWWHTENIFLQND